MRWAAKAAAILALIVLAVAFHYHRAAKRAVLTVVPTGQPQFQATGPGVYGTRTMVLLPVAVTNHSNAPLLCWIGVTIGENPGSGPWYAGREPLRIAPRSGTVTFAEYDPGNIFFHSGFLVVDYLKLQSPAERKIRRFLHGFGLSKVATNDLWCSQVIGRVVQH